MGSPPQGGIKGLDIPRGVWGANFGADQIGGGAQRGPTDVYVVGRHRGESPGSFLSL